MGPAGYLFSRTKMCSVRKLAIVKAPKKMPSRATFGHQNDYEVRQPQAKTNDTREGAPLL